MTPDTDSTERETLLLSGKISTRNRIAAAAVAVVAIAIAGLFVVFGLVLLLILAAAGTLIGAGVMLYHRLTGRWPRFLVRSPRSKEGLNPDREVFPDRQPDHAAHNEWLPPP